jgi:type II secretory pathway pseudopilin PulG
LVLIIIGVVGSLVYPRLASLNDANRANQAAAIVRSDLQMFITEAVKRKRPLRLVLVPANRYYRLIDRQSSAQLSERYLTGASAEYNVNSMTASVTTLDIFPNGIASGGLVVTVTVAGQQRQITLTRVGFVRVS